MGRGAVKHDPTPDDGTLASLLAADVGSLLGSASFETTANLDRPRQFRRRPHRRYLAPIREEELEVFFRALPAHGESVHIVSNGRFDYWSFVPVILRMLGRPAEEFFGSTWTMNRNNVVELFELIDSGKIRRAAMLTGTYFKRRESSVANTLIEGLAARGHRYRAFQNHTKVILIGAPPDYISMEGSANFTANPRLEQNVVSNDEELYRFHQGWMETILASGGYGTGLTG